MDAVILRGRRWLIAWVVLVLLLLAATRVAVVFIAVNGRDDLPSQLLADAITVAVVLFVAFSGLREAKWLGVLLFAMWGLASAWVAVRLGGAPTVSLRSGVHLLIADGVWGSVVQGLALLTAAGCLGFSVTLVRSRSINRYFALLRSPRV